MPTQAAASSTWCSSRSRPQHVGSPAGAALEAKEFYAKKGATEAHDRNDRIIYDKSSGKLHYDEDGNKAGGHGTVHFATLDKHPGIDAGDFLIV